MRAQTWMVQSVGGAALAALALSLGAQPSQARPGYLERFKESYPTVKAADADRCNVCHMGKPTAKTWNDYGAAMGKALNGKNVSDKEIVKTALKKAEAEKSAVEGKTFGELLKEGKLPGKAG